MKGTLLETGSRMRVAAIVSAWRVGDRTVDAEPMAVARAGDDGVFDLDLTIDLPSHSADVVLRVHRSDSETSFDPRRLAAVEQIAPGRAQRGLVVWVEPATAQRRLFARALNRAGQPLRTTSVMVADVTRRRPPQALEPGRGGWMTLLCPGDTDDERLRFWSGTGEATVAADWAVAPDVAEADLVFAGAGVCRAEGTVVRSTNGSGLAGVRVELLDRSGTWPSPVAVAPPTDDSGTFAVSFGQALTALPEPTFLVWSGDERIAAVDWPASWTDGVLAGVRLAVGGGEIVQLDGQVLNRRSRAGVPEAQVEVWDVDAARLLKVAQTEAEGRFSVTVRADDSGAPPTLRIRVSLHGNQIAEQVVPDNVWAESRAVVFVEADPPAALPVVYRVAGRLLDPTTHKGVSGLRVEAWDKAARPGGLVGVAAYVADDGTFDLALPPAGSADAGPPALFFRLYARDVLVATQDGAIRWDAGGLGTAVVEVAEPPQDGADEVVLHELGETIATAVNRMQSELGRYPNTLGAYVVDELDLSMPVAVQVDRLGQVRAKVIDRAPADEQLGRLRMRVRPVLGAQAPAANQLDQPLSVLSELSGDAIAKLGTLRVYSVEDLARLAQTAAGREALLRLRLGVDLDQLLDKVALLAVRGVPRPVREALLRLGVASAKAFVDHADPAALADLLSGELAQAITKEAVRVWQQRVADAMRVPLPQDNA